MSPCNLATDFGGCPYEVNNLQFPPDQVSKTLTDGPGNTATAAISIQPSATLPGVSVTSISAGVSGSYTSTAYVSFIYDFAVITPRGSVAFPHPTISAGGNVLGGIDSYATVALVQVSNNTRLFYDYACSLGNPGQCSVSVGYPYQSSFSRSNEIELAIDTLYAIEMTVSLQADGNAGQLSAFGSVDPIISLNAKDAPDFQLVFSPNIPTQLSIRKSPPPIPK